MVLALECREQPPAKKADERLMTVGLLLSRYQAARPGQTKQEPIAAAQSKAILTVLAWWPGLA